MSESELQARTATGRERRGTERGRALRSATTSPGARRRILVVEDNLLNERVALGLLHRLGYVADVVHDGAEALRALERRPYGLVLMDCEMPVMDGYQATREIRRREGVEQHTPIVALTAHALASDRCHCLETGMDDFVAKPVSLAALRQVVETWVAPVPGSST